MDIKFISLGQQDHAFLGSAFKNSTSLLTFAGCPSGFRMQLRPSDIVVSSDILRLF